METIRFAQAQRARQYFGLATVLLLLANVLASMISIAMQSGSKALGSIKRRLVIGLNSFSIFFGVRLVARFPLPQVWAVSSLFVGHRLLSSE